MRLLLSSSNFPQECCKHSLEHVFGSLWSRTLSGTIASEKCSSSQLVDLMMNEVWFGVHRLKSCVSKPNPRQEATFLAGPGWKYPFHLRPAAYGEMLISTTTSMGRTKILQFLPLRPPLGRTTKTCFCVGSDGHIRVEWMPLHSWRLRLWRMNTHQVASEGKVFLTHLAAAPSSVRFLHLFACCAVPVIFCCLLLKLRTKIWGFATPTILVIHLHWSPWPAGRILFHLSWLLIIRSQNHFNSSAWKVSCPPKWMLKY